MLLIGVVGVLAGTATVVVAGLIGYRVAGPRVGIMAATHQCSTGGRE